MAVIDYFTRAGLVSALWWLVPTLLLVAPGQRAQSAGVAIPLLIDAYAAVALRNPQ